MSIKVSITDLLQSIGSSNIRYQYIEQSMEGIKTKSGVTVISFATDAITPAAVVTNTGPKGIVLWIDRDLTSQCLTELKGGNGLTFDKLLQQRDELLAALQGMIDIANDSQGVAGYHLNGEVADWGEFEEWQAACDAIAKAKGGAS